MTLVLTMCMLMWTASAAMGESEMTEAQIAFTVVVTLGQDLSELMVHIYGEIPLRKRTLPTRLCSWWTK